MTRLFLDEAIPEDQEMREITGDPARYLNDVLRMRPGEELILCDKNRIDHICSIVSA